LTQGVIGSKDASNADLLFAAALENCLLFAGLPDPRVHGDGETLRQPFPSHHITMPYPCSDLHAAAAAAVSLLLLMPQVFQTPKFREMVKNCISQDLSWSAPAKKWEAVLEEVSRGCTAAPAKKASVPTPVQKQIVRA
jgi:granule-bound starch synthase